MVWSVAARFGFTETEMMEMPRERLRFWYFGHLRMYREERKLIGKGKR